MRYFLLALVCLPGIACQSKSDPFVTGSLADGSSIRLIWTATGADWTSHVPLTAGYTVRLKVRLFVADGREIVPLEHPLQMSFVFTPSTLATAATADSVTLLEDITPSDTAGASGSLQVSLTEPATGTNKSFGPFSVLIH